MSEITPETPVAPSPSGNPAADAPWEQKVLSDLAMAGLAEQRKGRRWNIFFKFAFIAYLSTALLIYVPLDFLSDGLDEPHTALVDLQGAIAADSEASADRVAGALRGAFEHEQTRAVILRINSPGGSPVQSGYINDEIVRLREKYPDIPLYAVIVDMAASGGYYVAAAADKIYADESSIVGSIGVVMNGFGFVEAMKTVGVERRLYTAGEHKGFLDPFSPAQPEEVGHLTTVLKDMHQQFIDVVRRGRGDRLKESDELFSGLLWTGRQSKELGLIDDFGSSSSVARDVVGVENIVDFTSRPGLIDRIADRFGASVGRTVMSSVSGSIPIPR
jgi:protease-4